MEEADGGGHFPRALTPDDLFYRALQPIWIKPGDTISSAAFSNPSASRRMSVDWAEKSTPVETFQRWERWGPARGVASLPFGVCRDNGQTVEFTPTPENEAHSDVIGQKGDRIRKNLAKGAKLIYQRS